MSDTRRIIQINNQWFDFRKIIHYWFTDDDMFYYVFENNSETYAIQLKNADEKKQFEEFLIDKIIKDYYYHKFEYKPPEPPKPKSTSTSSKTEEKQKPKGYFEGGIPR